MKKNDWILIGVILGIAAIFGLVQILMPSDSNANIQITVDGSEFAEYKLTDNIEVAINETNVLVIENGKASMIHANCPDQLCVQQKSISKNGESIVCLPNKVIVSVVGGEENEVDTVSN